MSFKIDYNSDDFKDYIKKISNLSKFIKQKYSKTQDVDELFRNLHSLKALTYFYNLDEISILIEKTETILYYINNFQCKKECILKWINEFSFQIDIWVQELKRGSFPSFFDVFFEEMPTVECKKRNQKINKTTEILLLSADYKFLGKATQIFKEKFKFIQEFTSYKECIIQACTPGDKVILTRLKYKDGNIVDLLRELKDVDFNFDNVFLVSEFGSMEKFKIFKDKIKLKNIINLSRHSIIQVQQAISTIKSKGKNISKIPNNNISLTELSKIIKPSSKNVIDLKSLCFSEKSDLKDIIKIMYKDPIFSAILLRNINSPFIGLPNRVSKIQVAVSLMGKKRVGAIVMSELSRDLFDNEPLQSYGLTTDNLIAVSLRRSQFISEWLKYVNIPQIKKDNIVSLTHLLPIGKIITNQALIHNNQAKRFKNNFDIGSPSLLEKQMLGYSSFDALVKIFELWNMPADILELAKNVSNFGVKSNFKDLDIYAAIVIVSTEMIRIDGSFSLEKKHLRFVERHNLNSDDMKNIFLKINDNKIQGKIF